MVLRLVIGGYRVQEVRHRDGTVAYTIVGPDGRVDPEAERFLARYAGGGSDRTYAYLLVDHLRWLESEGLALGAVSFRDLRRYMGAVGAKVPMPLGSPWRVGKRPYGNSALSGAASCLKGFYLALADCGVHIALREQLDVQRLPTRRDRDRSMLGHLTTTMPGNPLAPAPMRRRHPKMLPDDARALMLVAARSARDKLVIDWLADGGMFSGGQLCGGG